MDGRVATGTYHERVYLTQVTNQQTASEDMAKSLNGCPMMLILMMAVLLTFPLARARPRTETLPISEKDWQKALQQVIHLLQMQNTGMSGHDSKIADSTGLFPDATTGSYWKKNTSQKRNAELINSLLGLPRIMKVVG